MNLSLPSSLPPPALPADNTLTALLAPEAVRHQLARILLETGCVSLRQDGPFMLPSGWASPVYMNCRRLISFPAIREKLVALAVALLRERGCLDQIDAIAGGEASGIAFAAWIAQALNLPLLCVRKKAIGQQQVEGVLQTGQRVLLIDDMMSAGFSKARFCQALHYSGAVVRDVFVLFNYDTFPADGLLASMGVHLHALSTWRDILTVAQADQTFSSGDLREIKEFLDNPAGWSYAHGGLGKA